MNKLFTSLSAIAISILAISACNINPDDINVDEQGNYIYYFNLLSADETKTTLDGTTLKWEQGDKIGFFAEGSINKYGNIATLEPKVQVPVYLTAALTTGDKVYAYFPYVKDASTSQSIPFTIPAEQKGDMDSNPLVSLPYTVSGDMTTVQNNVADMRFCNLGSIIMFKVYSSNEAYRSETVQSIKFDANSNIAGSFNLNATSINYNDKSTLAPSQIDNGSTSIILTDSPIVGKSKNDAGTAYMVVIPGSYSGTVTVTTNDAEYTYKISSAKNFDRSYIKPLNVDLANGERTVLDNYVSLPWSWEGGSSAGFTSISGISANGLGSDYAASNTPYLIKLDDTEDFFTIKTDSSIGVVSIGVKMLGGKNTSSIKVQGSADGINYSDIQTLSISGAQNSEHTLSTTSAFDPSYRYVKAVFTKGSNVGVGPISISKPDNAPAILANDISSVAAAGEINAEGSYVVKNFTDDVEVTAFTGCVTDAIADGGELVYTVAPNYSGATANGKIVLCSAADNSITKTITVTQMADKFTVNETSLQLGNPANSSKTFKVTTTYDATITNPNPAKISISPMQINAGSENVVVTVTALAQNMSEEDVDEIGNIVITRSTGNTDKNKTKSIAVSQDVKPSAGVVSYTLSFPDANYTNNKVSSYTDSWTAICDDLSWTICNFNNNNWNNDWTYIKCGRKNNESTASITTAEAIPEAINTVKITIDKIGNVSSATLSVAASSDFTGAATYSIPMKTGKQVISIPNPAVNNFYKIEFVCTSASSNGPVQISQIVYSK